MKLNSITHLQGTNKSIAYHISINYIRFFPGWKFILRENGKSKYVQDPGIETVNTTMYKHRLRVCNSAVINLKMSSFVCAISSF